MGLAFEQQFCTACTGIVLIRTPQSSSSFDFVQEGSNQPDHGILGGGLMVFPSTSEAPS